MSVARQAILLWAAVAVMTAALTVTDVHRIATGETGDFVHFYAAAAAVRQGGDPYAAHTRGYIYPPLLAYAAQPLAALPVRRAAAVMLVVNVAVTLATAALLAAEFLRRFDAPRRDAAAVAAVVLIGLLLDVDKVKGEWQMWQTDVWMLLLFALSLRWVDRRPVLAGAALGVAANLKYFPLLLLPYLLLRRRWVASGSLVAATAIFAVAPAAQVGWVELGREWATAARGITGMAGPGTGGERAEIHALGDALSCSVTSAIARATGGGAAVPLAIATAAATALFVAATWAYRRHGVRMTGDAAPAVTAVEWPVLVAVLLAFSPQTNTRHLFDAVLLTTAAAVLLLVPLPGVGRVPLIAGCAALALGFTLPPGSRTVQGHWSPTTAWLRVGGPCWCLLAAAAGLLWTGLGRAAASDPPLVFEPRTL